MSYVLFIDQEEVKKYSIIGGQVDPDKLTGCIETVQETIIEDELGDTLCEKLKSLIDDGTIHDPENADYKTLWINYVKKMQIFYTISEYLSYAGMRVENDGFVKSAPENATPVSDDERADAANRARETADKYQRRFIAYMCDGGSAKFPEWNQADLIYPNKSCNYTNMNF